MAARRASEGKLAICTRPLARAAGCHSEKELSMAHFHSDATPATPFPQLAHRLGDRAIKSQTHAGPGGFAESVCGRT